jgi:hypothetical protein
MTVQTITITKHFVIETLIDELCDMVERDPQKGTEYQSAFIGEKTKAKTVQIGETLLRYGEKAVEPEELMVHAYYKVLERHGIMSARMLEVAWDGIGDWRG